MVTSKQLADFKQTLPAALEKAGYIAYGRISSSDYNFYAHLPEQEMVSQYAEDNNLDEVNRVYRIIKYIKDNSGKYFSLKILCEEQGIEYRIFAHAVENLPYVQKVGDRRNTQYNWIHDEEPSFNIAKEMVEHMRKLKATKLNKIIKEKIRQAVAKGLSRDDLFKFYKIKKGATYNAEAYFRYQKMRQQKKDEDNDIKESLTDSTFEPESSSIIPEQKLEEQSIVNVESVPKDENVQIQPDVYDDAGLQMENYILNQEIKYLKKIIKAKNKLIKALRKKE
jgi:hypothetical protein